MKLCSKLLVLDRNTSYQINVYKECSKEKATGKMQV